MLKTPAPIGYGTWNRPGEDAFQGVVQAWLAGYRHFDCAEGYENEEYVGRAFKDMAVPRDEIWVTTKVAPESFGPGQVRPHVEASLEKLGVGPVDLLLLHYPSINDEYEMSDYIAQFRDVMDAGLARNLGVSNFTVPLLNRAIDLLDGMPLVTNQVELHPFLANTSIVEHCRNLSIHMTAYSPLARGAVADDPILTKIARAYDATAAQVALAWLLAKGYWVIPSAGNAPRISENLAAGDLALTSEDVARIDALDRNLRLVDGPWCPEWDI